MKLQGANIFDLDYFEAAGKQYLAESGDPFEMDVAHARNELAKNLDKFLVLRRDNRAFAHVGINFEPVIWNPTDSIARVFSIWVDPDHRGGKACYELIRTAEAFATVRGAKLVMFDEHLKMPGVGRVYRKLGYKPVQTLFVRAA